MSKVIDFETTNKGGNDTGEADSTAIAPIEFGESAVPSTFNRPLEVLRGRTEVLRAAANDLAWVQDADRGMIMLVRDATEGLTYGGSSLQLDAGYLDIFPFITPSGPQGEKYESAGTSYPSRMAHLKLTDVEFISKKFVFEGGNEISIAITDMPGSGALNIQVLGDGTVADPMLQPGKRRIQIRYDSTQTHTIASVVTAVNNHAVASTLVQAEGNSLAPMYDVAEEKLQGGLDGVFHRVPASSLAGFFTDPRNALRNGDTLAIWYADSAIRRRSIEETGEETIPATGLINLRVEPEKSSNAIPIGRRITATQFVLANGRELTAGVPVANLGRITTKDVHGPGLLGSGTNYATAHTAFEGMDSRIALNTNKVEALEHRTEYILRSFPNRTIARQEMAIGEVAYIAEREDPTQLLKEVPGFPKQIVMSRAVRAFNFSAGGENYWTYIPTSSVQLIPIMDSATGEKMHDITLRALTDIRMLEVVDNLIVVTSETSISSYHANGAHAWTVDNDPDTFMFANSNGEYTFLFRVQEAPIREDLYVFRNRDMEGTLNLNDAVFHTVFSVGGTRDLHGMKVQGNKVALLFSRGMQNGTWALYFSIGYFQASSAGGPPFSMTFVGSQTQSLSVRPDVVSLEYDGKAMYACFDEGAHPDDNKIYKWVPGNDVEVLSNPVSSGLNLIASDGEFVYTTVSNALQVHDLEGRKVAARKFSGLQDDTFTVSTFFSGEYLYVARITDTGPGDPVYMRIYAFEPVKKARMFRRAAVGDGSRVPYLLSLVDP